MRRVGGGSLVAGIRHAPACAMHARRVYLVPCPLSPFLSRFRTSHRAARAPARPVPSQCSTTGGHDQRERPEQGTCPGRTAGAGGPRSLAHASAGVRATNSGLSPGRAWLGVPGAGARRANSAAPRSLVPQHCIELSSAPIELSRRPAPRAGACRRPQGRPPSRPAPRRSPPPTPPPSPSHASLAPLKRAA